MEEIETTRPQNECAVVYEIEEDCVPCGQVDTERALLLKETFVRAIIRRMNLTDGN